MLAEMTAGSQHRRGFERIQQKQQRSEKLRGLRVKEQRASGFKACLTFCLMERTEPRMEPRTEPRTEARTEPRMEPRTEPRTEQREPPHAASERRMRELTIKWFIETQVPHIIHNGLFPTWFLGFISRKHAEEILRDKEAGCFLIRLSDKAIGYILSYKGGDRCRHFVINQSASGGFVVAGDTAAHHSVSDLISHFRRQPIQPFGEYLTSSCFEALNEELYDVIQVNSEQEAEEQPPALPPKSSPTLEEVPPLPSRSQQMGGGREPTGATYTKLNKRRCGPGVRGPRSGAPPCRPPRTSQLGTLECKSRSLPHMDQRCDYEKVYQQSPSPPRTPPRLSPSPPPQAASSSRSLDYLDDTALYHLAGPAAPDQQEALYAEVVTHQDNTYELIPGLEGGDYTAPRDPQEPQEPQDPRPKHGHLTDRLKNDKWKWWLPEVRKKY